VLEFCDPTKEQHDIYGVATSQLRKAIMGGSCASYFEVGLSVVFSSGIENKSMWQKEKNSHGIFYKKKVSKQPSEVMYPI
jgi:hypothetical protein